MTPLNFVVHTTAPPSTLIPSVRGILRELEPAARLSNITTLGDLVGESVAARRFTTFFLASLAAVALLLAAAAGIACYHPARDAMRLDVLTAIRDE